MGFGSMQFNILLQPFRIEVLIYVPTIQLMPSQITLIKGQYIDLLRRCPSNLHLSSHRVTCVILWPLLLTWFNFNPSMDK